MTEKRALEIAKIGINKEPLQDRIIVLAITEDKIDEFETKTGIVLGEGDKKSIKDEKSSTLGPAIVIAVGPGKGASQVTSAHDTPSTFSPGDKVYCFPNQIEADIMIDEVLYLVFKEDRVILKEKPKATKSKVTKLEVTK